MSNRREFLTGAALFAAATSASFLSNKETEGGDPSFMNNVPDPVLAGQELPTFKFALEKSAGKVVNSYGKEATVEQLPISNRGDCASCTGTPRPTSGNTSLMETSV